MISYLRRQGEVFLLLVVVITAALWGVSQLFPPFSMPQKVLLAVTLLFWIAGFAACLFLSEFPFFKQHSSAIGLAILIVYVVVLGLATASEILDLNWFAWL
jgi:FtsH-binding integral membrane protein